MAIGIVLALGVGAAALTALYVRLTGGRRTEQLPARSDSEHLEDAT
ncbi:MAG TPA: hypothetical protein VNO86_10585 [Candidatus Binatia bacterium]|nr:hypothetical protein [Candidatus Binatia bacterium]